MTPLSKIVLAMIIGGYLTSPAVAQSSDFVTQAAIEATLNNYLDGSSHNDPKQIKSAFYPESDMFLDHAEKPIYRMNSFEYAALFEKRERGVFNGRFGKILDIDIEGDIATAKAEIVLPRRESRYIDIFILKKLSGEWKVISKAAGRADSNRTGEKTLLIVTDKRKSEDFSDLIADYEKMAKVGYTVDIVSPDGGAINFKGLDMRKPTHKKYLYDADFMYALENTLSPANITASDYVSATYVCDKDAKRSEAGHKDIDALYASICSGKNSCAK